MQRKKTKQNNAKQNRKTEQDKIKQDDIHKKSDVVFTPVLSWKFTSNSDKK